MLVITHYTIIHPSEKDEMPPSHTPASVSGRLGTGRPGRLQRRQLPACAREPDPRRHRLQTLLITARDTDNRRRGAADVCGQLRRREQHADGTRQQCLFVLPGHPDGGAKEHHDEKHDARQKHNHHDLQASSWIDRLPVELSGAVYHYSNLGRAAVDEHMCTAVDNDSHRD